MEDTDWTYARAAFLQALMARGSITEIEGRQIMAAIADVTRRGEDAPTDPGSIEVAHLHELIAATSEVVAPLDFLIRSATHQQSGTRVWALVNMVSDPQTQLATSYTADEIGFINRILDAMFDEFNRPEIEVMSIHEMQTVRFARPRSGDDGEIGVTATGGAAGGLKHSEVEKVLANLVLEGWLERSTDGFYSLSARALLELRSWLVDRFNDEDLGPDEWQRIKTCDACREIITTGQRCGDLACFARLHDSCQDAFWRTRRSRHCPRCGIAWTDRHFVGERAVTTTRAYRLGTRRSRGGRKSTLADEIIQRGGDVPRTEPAPDEAGEA